MHSVKDRHLKAAIKRVGHLATELYDLMETGMTIDLTFPRPRVMPTSDKHLKSNRLIVTKPGAHLALKQPAIGFYSPSHKVQRKK